MSVTRKRKLNDEEESFNKKAKLDDTTNQKIVDIMKLYIKKIDNWKKIDKNVRWRLFEYYCCMKMNLVPWHMISPSVKDNLGIPLKDYGIDGISLDFKTALQVKYRHDSSITYRELSTFFTTATCLTKSEKLILMKNKRAGVATLINKLPCEVISIDEKEFINDLQNYSAKQIEHDKIEAIKDIAESKIESSQNVINPIENTKIEAIKDIAESKIESSVSICTAQNVIPIIENVNADKEQATNSSEIKLFTNMETKSSLLLRDYQIKALETCLNLKSKKKNIRIQMPCGSGKTLVALEYIKRFPNENIVIFVPSLSLVEQWSAIIPNMIKIGSAFKYDMAKQKNVKNTYICVYNSSKVLNFVEEFHTVIIDEGHHLDFEDFERKDSFRANIINLNTKNRIFLSATLDDAKEIDFKYELEEAIDKKYLCDYDITIPIVKNKDTVTNLIHMLNDRLDFRYILAYCNTRESGQKFAQKLNKHGISAQYFDGETSLTKRREIITKFENEEYRVLVTVYVLSEGIDIPIATTCFFVEPRSSKINIVQCIGRVLRLHTNKTFAHVILPCSREEETLRSYLRTIVNSDNRVKSSVENRRIGRINFEKIIYDFNISSDSDDDSDSDDEKDDEENEDISSYYLALYNRLGSWIANSDPWEIKLKLLKDYITVHHIIPAVNTKYKEVRLGSWACTNRNFYRNGKLSQDKIDKLNGIPEWKWEYDNDFWTIRYNVIKEYVDLNKKLPSPGTIFNGFNISYMIKAIRQLYHKKLFSKEQIALLNALPYWKWDVRGEKWNDKFEELKTFYAKYNRFPKLGDINNKNLHTWILGMKDKKNSKKLSKERNDKMKVFPEWNKSWLDCEWDRKYLLLQEFYKEYNRNIQTRENYKEEKLGKWAQTQRSDAILNKLSDERKKLLESNKFWKWSGCEKYDIEWQEKYNLLVKFMDENHRLIKRAETYQNVKLGIWLSLQRTNYFKKTLTPDRLALLEKLKYNPFVK